MTDEPTRDASRITQRVTIIALLWLAFALRVWNLAAPSVWWDEAYTVQTARYSWDVFWQLQSIARHPPLYFLSVSWWGTFAGWSEFSLRLLSVMYGLLGLALVYKLAARVFNARAGVAAMAVAAISPALVLYAQEGRMYALVFMLACGTLYFGARNLTRAGDRFALHTRTGQGFILFEAALLLTHYFAIPLVAAINLFILIDLIRRQAYKREVARWIIGQLIAVLPLIGWVLLIGLSQGGLAVANEPRSAWLTLLWQTVVLWLTGIRDLDGRSVLIFWGAIALIFFAAVLAWRNNRRTKLVLAFGGCSLVLAFLLANVLTSFHPRYVLVYSIPLFILIGGALNFDRRFRLTAVMWYAAVAGLTLAGWKVALEPQYAKDDARGAAAYLRSHSEPGDVILVEANDYTLSYYDRGLAATKMITAETDADLFNQLSVAIGTAPHVWLAHWNVSTQDRRGYRRFLLEQTGRLIDWTTYQGYELYEYEMQTPIAQPVLIDRLPIDFKIATAVASSAIVDRGDGALTVAIQWRRSDRSSSDARAALRLIDARGQEINSVNVTLWNAQGQAPLAWPIDQAVMNYYVLPIPVGTPPLAYALNMRVYGSTGESSEQALGVVQLSRRLDTDDPYRTLGGYHWQTISSTAIRPGLNLEAFSVASQMPKPLDQVDVTLRWRKTGSIDNTAPRVQLIQNDRAWVDLESDLFERDYPIEQWITGETVLEHRTLVYPPIAGEAQLQIGQGESWTTLFTTTLNTAALSFSAPTLQYSQAASYKNFVDLLGYDLPVDSIALYQPLELTTYWRVMNTEPLITSYTIFAQLIAADGHLVAQQDGLPSPIVNAWVKGQIIADRRALEVIDPAYRGSATLIVGWYNSATIERVKTINGDDHVTLQTPVRMNEQ